MFSRDHQTSPLEDPWSKLSHSNSVDYYFNRSRISGKFKTLICVDNDIDSSHELVPNDIPSMYPNNVVSDYCFKEKDKE